MQVAVNGLTDALNDLASVSAYVAQARVRALTRCAMIAHRDSIRNAPRSPSQKIKTAMRKTTRKVKRNDRATSRPKPGGLERSIDFSVTSETAEIFVARNGEAGKYAYRIHEEGPNGSGKWRNPGPGTIAKGARAGDKFIERAITDNQDNFLRIIKSEIDKEWRKLG
jgi:hypothetical protein